VTGIPWAKLGLPKWLQSALENTLEDAAPAIFETALGWVFEKQHPHLLKSRVEPLTEIKGISEGICSTMKNCNATAWESKLQKLNMLPELIRMTCSMIGASGSATADGKLLQLRCAPQARSSPALSVPLTKIAQGWPELWANFRALIGIFSQSDGPSLAIWANPVQFCFWRPLTHDRAVCSTLDFGGGPFANHTVLAVHRSGPPRGG
jgi:hypothetical protein